MRMTRFLSVLLLAFLTSCHTTTYFIVRHAEKETSGTMTTDVPLSAQGQKRAQALDDSLRNVAITGVYSTNYLRTRSTVQPVADQRGLTIQTYQPGDTAFADRLRQLRKGKVLIAGHSNTVDDLVNRLAGARYVPGDLPDSQYGDLFVVKRKGKRFSFEHRHFGE